MNRQNKDSPKSDKLTWLANQILTAFPQELTGLRFYILDCGCIYYQRLFRDGDIDPQIGIYRDAENGACESCMVQGGSWKERVIHSVIVYGCRFKPGTLNSVDLKN